MIEVPNTLAPVTWGFPGYDTGADAAAGRGFLEGDAPLEKSGTLVVYLFFKAPPRKKKRK